MFVCIQVPGWISVQGVGISNMFLACNMATSLLIVVLGASDLEALQQHDRKGPNAPRP